MNQMRVIPAVLLASLLTACSTQTSIGGSGSLTSVGMFYVGGQVEEGGTAHSDQALVHYFRSNASTSTPVVLYPGLGLSSYIYISTPDGREGWAQQFARAGHAAYVYDPVNTGPSGFPASAFGGEAPATVSTWNINEIWPRWGFGDARDVPYDNVRFPVEYMDQFYASWPPRLAADTRARQDMSAGRVAPAGRAGRGGRTGSPKDIAALVELLEKTGPAVLIPHSMGGATVFAVAAQSPELVKGIVVVEPVGCPRSAAAVENWKHVPFLAVYGDFIDSRGQTGRRDACRITADLVNQAGGNGTMLELTAEGIYGNTHLLMQDNNSADIGAKIIAWIQANVD